MTFRVCDGLTRKRHPCKLPAVRKSLYCRLHQHLHKGDPMISNKLGFVFEDTVYVSESFALLKDKCLELGAHRTGRPPVGRDLRNVILPVTDKLLAAFMVDFNVVELPAAETFGQPIPDPVTVERTASEKAPYVGWADTEDPEPDTEDDEVWAGIAADADAILEQQQAAEAARRPVEVGMEQGPVEDPRQAGEYHSTARGVDLDEVWIGAPQVGDRVRTPDFPGWNGGIVVGTDGDGISGRFPIRVERRDGSYGLFALDEVIMQPEAEEETERTPAWPLPVGPEVKFYVRLEDPKRLASIQARIAATVFAGHKVTLLPATSPRLRDTSFYVRVEYVA